METVGIEQEFPLLGRREGFRLLEQLHDAGPDGHGNSHDDALAHAVDGVLLAVVGSVELKAGYPEIIYKFVDSCDRNTRRTLYLNISHGALLHS